MMVGEAACACIAADAGAGPGEAASVPGSGKPRANPNLAPRCGAKTRAGCACQAPAMANGRCRIHGGTSTGPRTAAGFANLAAARTTSGDYSAASWASNRYHRTMAVRLRLLVAARQLQAFLPPDLAARLATVPAELSAPVLYPQTPEVEITTKTLGSGELDARGRFAASARAAPRGRFAASARAAPRGRGGAGGGASGPGGVGAVAGGDRRGEAGQAGGAGGASGGSNRKPRHGPYGAGAGRLSWGPRGGGRGGGGGCGGAAPGVALAGPVRGPGDGRALPVGCGAAGGGPGMWRNCATTLRPSARGHAL